MCAAHYAAHYAALIKSSTNTLGKSVRFRSTIVSSSRIVLFHRMNLFIALLHCCIKLVLTSTQDCRDCRETHGQHSLKKYDMLGVLKLGYKVEYSSSVSDCTNKLYCSLTVGTFQTLPKCFSNLPSFLPQQLYPNSNQSSTRYPSDKICPRNLFAASVDPFPSFLCD